MSTQTPFLIFCYEMFCEWWMKKQCSAYRLSPSSKVNVFQIHIPHHQLVLLQYGGPPGPETVSALPCHSPAPSPTASPAKSPALLCIMWLPSTIPVADNWRSGGHGGVGQHSFYVGVSCHAKWPPLIRHQDQQGVPQPHLTGSKKHLLV